MVAEVQCMAVEEGSLEQYKVAEEQYKAVEEQCKVVEEFQEEGWLTLCHWSMEAPVRT
jgi:hypothetical protein